MSSYAPTIGSSSDRSDGIDSSKIVGGSAPGSSSGKYGSSGPSSNTRSGIRGGSGAQTYNKFPDSAIQHPFDGSTNDSDNIGRDWTRTPPNRIKDLFPSNPDEYGFHDLDYNILDFPDTKVVEPKKEKPKHVQGIQSDSSKQVALIISIVAGVLIVVIIIILIVLKCNGKSREISKIEEAKTYASLSQGPTMIVNGQGNGTVKAGDRRPVKKERKDVKEWYV